MLDLGDKDFKIALTHMLYICSKVKYDYQWLTEKACQQKNGSYVLKIRNSKLENIFKENRNIWNEKNSLQGFNSRMDTAEDGSSEKH